MTPTESQANADAQHEKEQEQKAWCEDCDEIVFYLVGEDCDFCENCKSVYVERLKEGE